MLLDDINTITASSEVTFTLYALKVTKSKLVATRITIKDEDLSVFSKGCLSYLAEKQYQDKDIKTYPHGIPKDHIETIPVTSDIISSRYQELLRAISSPETNNIDINRYGAYVIVSTIGNKLTYFINMKKPLKNYKYSTFLGMATSGNQFKKINNELLNLVYHFDCIISGKICHFITLAAEPVFNLQQFHEKQTLSCKSLLLGNVIDSSGLAEIETYLKKPGKYRAICNFDQEKTNLFSQVNINHKDAYEAKYRLSFLDNGDGTCRVDLSSEDKVSAFIATITSKRALDFDNKIVETPVPFKPV